MSDECIDPFTTVGVTQAKIIIKINKIIIWNSQQEVPFKCMLQYTISEMNGSTVSVHGTTRQGMEHTGENPSRLGHWTSFCNQRWSATRRSFFGDFCFSSSSFVSVAFSKMRASFLVQFCTKNFNRFWILSLSRNRRLGKRQSSSILLGINHPGSAGNINTLWVEWRRIGTVRSRRTRQHGNLTLH